MTKVSATMVIDLETKEASLELNGAGEPYPTKSLIDNLEEFMRDKVGPLMLEHLGMPEDITLEEETNTDWESFRANIAKFEDGIIQDLGLEQYWIIVGEDGQVMTSRMGGNEIQSILASAATEAIRTGKVYRVAKVFGTVSQNQNGAILWR